MRESILDAADWLDERAEHLAGRLYSRLQAHLHLNLPLQALGLIVVTLLLLPPPRELWVESLTGKDLALPDAALAGGVTTLAFMGLSLVGLSWLKRWLTKSAFSIELGPSSRLPAWAVTTGILLQMLVIWLTLQYGIKGDALNVMEPLYTWPLAYALLAIPRNGRRCRRCRVRGDAIAP